MGFFDLFKPKPKLCSACQNECFQQHKYNPIYFEGKETRKNPLLIPRLLCQDCFLGQVKADLLAYRDKVVFIRPLLAEGYSFTKFSAQQAGMDPSALRTFLSPDGAVCHKCRQSARFTWIDGDVQKEKHHPAGTLCFKTKEECPDYKYLCTDHLMEEFAASIKADKLFFMEFWPIKEGGDGYCW